MSLSLSHSRLYALAEQARTKFGEAANAKDQRLLRLLAHAHLYDELDDHFEKLRIKRTLSSTCPPYQALSVPIEQDVARPQEQRDEDNSGWSEDSAKGTFHKWDLINECAILDDEPEDIPPSNCSGEGPLVDDDQVVPAGSKIDSHSAPALAAEVSNTSADQTVKEVLSTSIDSQVTVSELPIDDDDDSDSESDSDCDTLVDSDEQTATPISIFKPKAPYHNIDADISLDLAPKPIDDMEEFNTITNNDAFPALERSKPSSQLPTSHESPPPANPSKHQSLTSLKTSPLSPQLCDSSTCPDVSSSMSQSLRLQQALQRLLRLCATPGEPTTTPKEQEAIS
ncbi:MAG: hypothetical protein LQ350_007264 [Teloschistes chrysophthalmus]|nr:MAG: hypothetical protein LQ350_007264 [Niorma chrysophthalma]